MDTKNPKLIDKMLRNPLDFELSEFHALIAAYKLDDGGGYDTAWAFKDLRECVRRIYDLNEDALRTMSSGSSGRMGKFNKKSTKTRKKRYLKKIINQKEGQEYVRIYAEGDSWYQFPYAIKDIIDWLNTRKDYLIYCEAYAGDWITNIIYEGQYVESLSMHTPDVFLVSGGGNDLVGDHKLTIMVSGKGGERCKYHSGHPLEDSTLSQEEKSMIMLAQPYITKEFYAFLWTVRAQYTILFGNLYREGSKHRNMISLIQGYAYPYPKNGPNFSFRYPWQFFVNWWTKSGKWFYVPFMMKGISDKKLQRAIAYAFVYEFNKVLIELDAQFEKVHYIDCRPIPKNQNDWFDEMHLKSHVFKKVANSFMGVIDKYANKSKL